MAEVITYEATEGAGNAREQAIQGVHSSAAEACGLLDEEHIVGDAPSQSTSRSTAKTE